MSEEKRINLKGGDSYITEDENNAFRVVSGVILVYIVPFNNNEIGRRAFIYEASEGEVLPSFCFCDMEYRNWRFCFSALEQAVIEVIENGSTKLLKKRFAEKVNLRNFEVEGYNGGLVDKYRINTVAEDGFIRRTQKERENTAYNTLKEIYGAFRQNDKTGSESEKTGVPLYDCAAVLCARKHISIAPIEKIREACGDTFGMTDIARLSHFSYREVTLEDGWHRTDSGELIVFDDNKKPYLCLTNGSRSYSLYDPQTGSEAPVSSKTARKLSEKAFMIYRAFPSKKLGFKDIFVFCKFSVRAGDIVWLTVLSVLTALIGVLSPTINQKLYDDYIPLGSKAVLFQLGFVMASFMLANIMFRIVKNLVNFRISSKISYDTQSALYDRMFALPESFFRKFDSADLAQRVMGAGVIINSLSNVFFTSIAAVIYLIIYSARMSRYSAKLAAVGGLMVIIYAAVSLLISNAAIKHKKRSAELKGVVESKMFQFLTGISKIKAAGVEDRVLLEYMRPYIKFRNSEEKSSIANSFVRVLALVSNSIFTAIIYMFVIGYSSDISAGEFVAFGSLFGAFTVYATELVKNGISVRNKMPQFSRLKPILSETPELNDDKELPGDLSGAIEVNNVCFSYSPDEPPVLNGLSLNIKPGEYVGIVGSSGCGKSTLIKLLLGFEKTDSGKIYFDNKDIENLDKRELRKKIGVVLQDGKLISGSIFENITITAPKATVRDVEVAVGAVGLADDINQMPMGLHTVLSEDCSTISGGQQQRILIARAIISNPKILLFDEATSALDNITQNMVCETIEKMSSTRIVIAHRLSTIIKCDRIIVMDEGRIVEQGTFDELMQNNGLFRQFASRQIV